MSWPTDGLPRFVVREHTGYPIGSREAKTGSKSQEGLSVRVADRAYAWRTVRAWTSEDERGGARLRAENWARIRARAADLAADLNARHD